MINFLLLLCWVYTKNILSNKNNMYIDVIKNDDGEKRNDCLLMNKRSYSLQRFLLYLTIISSFSSSLWFSVKLGPIHMFPYRYFLILLWLLFVVSIFVHNGKVKISNIKVRPYLHFFALWVGYAFLSVMWAADQIEALRNIIFLFTGASIIFFLIYNLTDLNRIKLFYWLWLIIFMFMIPIGFWEVVTGNHLCEKDLLVEGKFYPNFAPLALLGGQNEYATYIALTIPMVIAWMIHYPRLYSRILAILVLISSLFLLVMTTSRSNYIAFLLSIIFWFVFILSVKSKIKASVIIIFVSIFVLNVQELSVIITDQMASIPDVILGFSGNSIDDSSTRPNLIKNALYFTVQSAGFGVGAGNAEYYMENHSIFPTGGITNVHNWWAEIAVNYGIFIFAGYVILYITLILNLWRAHKRIRERTEKMICEALLIGLVSFFTASISSSSIIAFPPHWIFFGFALAFLNYTRIKALERSNPCAL